MLCISAAYQPSCGVYPSVSACVSVGLSRSWILSKRINIQCIFKMFSPSGSHTILAFLHTERHGIVSTGTPCPNGGVECRRGGQKWRFWANLPPSRAVNACSGKWNILSLDGSWRVDDTIVAGKRWSLLMAGDDDEVYDKKHQRYAKDNGATFNCTQW